MIKRIFFVTNNDLAFSKSAVTRFSHDLAGVIGAVANSLCLLGELGGCDEETLNLATNNAEILLARLRFFRAAFGNDGPLSDLKGTKQLAESYIHSIENKSCSFKLNWKVDEDLPLFNFRVLLIALQIMAESMMYGGEIEIEAAAGFKNIVLRGISKKIKTEENLENVFAGQEVEITPKLTGAYFIKSILDQFHWHCQIDKTETELQLCFKG